MWIEIKNWIEFYVFHLWARYLCTLQKSPNTDEARRLAWLNTAQRWTERMENSTIRKILAAVAGSFSLSQVFVPGLAVWALWLQNGCQARLVAVFLLSSPPLSLALFFRSLFSLSPSVLGFPPPNLPMTRQNRGKGLTCIFTCHPTQTELSTCLLKFT